MTKKDKNISQINKKAKMKLSVSNEKNFKLQKRKKAEEISDDDLISEPLENLYGDSIINKPLILDLLGKPLNPSLLLNEEDSTIALPLLYSEKSDADSEEPNEIDEVMEKDVVVESYFKSYKPTTPLSSEDYNDKNQFLFAKRIELVKEIEILEDNK